MRSRLAEPGRARWSRAGVICVALDGMVLGNEEGTGIATEHSTVTSKLPAIQIGTGGWCTNLIAGSTARSAVRNVLTATCPNSMTASTGGDPGRIGMARPTRRNSAAPTLLKSISKSSLTAEPSKYIRHFCARTWKEHKEAAKRGEHPNLKEMPRKTPAPVQPPRDPAPAVPLPQRQRPAAMAKPEHRDSARPLTTRQRKELVLRIPIYIQGDGNGRQDRNTGEWIGPGDPDYRGPLNKQAATLMACNSMCQTDGVSFRRALEAAAEAGFRVESLERSGAVARAAGYTIEGLENASPPEGEKEQT